MTVKGSKEYRYHVVRKRPYANVILAAVVVVVVIASTTLAYFHGLENGTGELAGIKQKLITSQEKLQVLEASEVEAKRALQSALLGAEVDKSSLEDVRKQIAVLKEQIAALEEDNAFYRNLMAPSESKKGLNFGVIEILETDIDRTYRFKVVMQQLATQHQLLTGTLNFNIVGRQDDAVTVLSISDVSQDIDSGNIKLRFKYFQNIEGSLVLPEGFLPERIELEARASKPKPTVIEKRFAWIVQEQQKQLITQ